jgi:hypothetical protein
VAEQLRSLPGRVCFARHSPKGRLAARHWLKSLRIAMPPHVPFGSLGSQGPEHMPPGKPTEVFSQTEAAPSQAVRGSFSARSSQGLGEAVMRVGSQRAPTIAGSDCVFASSGSASGRKGSGVGVVSAACR